MTSRSRQSFYFGSFGIISGLLRIEHASSLFVIYRELILKGWQLNSIQLFTKYHITKWLTGYNLTDNKQYNLHTIKFNITDNMQLYNITYIQSNTI